MGIRTEGWRTSQGQSIGDEIILPRGRDAIKRKDMPSLEETLRIIG